MLFCQGCDGYNAFVTDVIVTCMQWLMETTLFRDKLIILIILINLTLIVDLPFVNKKLVKIIFWQLSKIILYRKKQSTYTIKCGCLAKNNIFPIHQMKPGQVDWQKLVFQEEFVLFQRK